MTGRYNTVPPIAEGCKVSSHIETVLNALHHKTVSFLPRGELFIDESFLDHYFSEYKGQYVKQLETAAQGLGLSVIGVG